MRVARFVLSRVVCVTSVTLLASAIIAVLALLAATTFTSAQTANPRDAFGPDLLSCSPAPCVLGPTQASEDGAADAAVVADPASPKNLMVGSLGSGCYPGAVGAFLSFDGGSDWIFQCLPSTRYEGALFSPTSGPANGPIVGYDHNGVAYLGGTYDTHNQKIYFEGFQKSSDGVTWSTPAPALGRRDYIPYDCWMAVDANATSPYVNSVYISCVMQGKYVNHLLVSHSADGGATWQAAEAGPAQVYPDGDFNTTMTVGKDGTLYLTWMYCNSTPTYCATNPVYILFAKSHDGGNTWSKPSQVATVTLHALPNVVVEINNVPAIGADNSNGPRSGNLYVVIDNWTGTYLQVEVVRSIDGGDTWSTPVPVAPGITHDQFFPWISVSPDGLVGVSWLDRRNDPANVDYQAFAGISSDGGLTFQPNVQLTTAFSNPALNGQFEMGSFTGNTWDGPNYFIAAWMDTSNGVETQDVVGGIRLK